MRNPATGRSLHFLEILVTPEVAAEQSKFRGIARKVPSHGVNTDQWLAGDGSNSSDPPEKENPGALAGATGADDLCIEGMEKAYRIKRAWAMALREAIRECDPTDAALILSDELERLRIGAPIPPLLNAMDEAQTWASWATPFEIKAFCLACYNAMPPKAQAGFLAYVTGRSAV
jgi:hypothetical protein